MTGARLERFRRKPGQRPLVFGHRGARARAPENTLAAFELALDEGAEGVELDVRTLSDGTLVVAHDDLLRSGSGAELRLSTLTLDALRAEERASDTRVPTLGEVLSWAEKRGALLNVELKRDVTAPSAMARRAAEELATQDPGRLLVSSFAGALLPIVRARLPAVGTALLIEAREVLFAAALRVAAPWRWFGADAVHPQHPLLTPDCLGRLVTKRTLINSWTVNDPAVARRLASGGIDGLVTDDPRGLLEALG
jgi:glycerophosphoryl diester phosphodiesterase